MFPVKIDLHEMKVKAYNNPNIETYWQLSIDGKDIRVYEKHATKELALKAIANVFALAK